MRTFQMIAGTLFLADGLAALIGGKRLAHRLYSLMPTCCPDCCKDTMKELADLDPRVLTAWGVNNALAGGLMILTALGDECCDKNPHGSS